MNMNEKMIEELGVELNLIKKHGNLSVLEIEKIEKLIEWLSFELNSYERIYQSKFKTSGDSQQEKNNEKEKEKANEEEEVGLNFFLFFFFKEIFIFIIFKIIKFINNTLTIIYHVNNYII